jgi:outer membrane protein, heavy metal efflux system
MLLIATLTLLAAPLTLDDSLDQVEKMVPAFLAAQTDVAAAEGEYVAALGGFDPNFRGRGVSVPIGGYPQTRADVGLELPTALWGTTFSAGYRLGLGDIQSYYQERSTFTAGELRAGAAIPVLRNGPIDRRRANESRAVLSKESAAESLEVTRLDVRRLTRIRFAEWLAAHQRRDVARHLLTLAESRNTQLERRVTAGDVAKIDVLDNQRAVAQRRALLAAGERGVIGAAFELGLFVRTNTGTPRKLDNDTPAPPPLPDATAPEFDAALARRPDLKRLIAAQKQFSIEARLAQNQVLPAVDVGVNVSQDVGQTTTTAPDKLGKPELELSLSVEFPLLFRQPSGRLTQAQAANEKAKLQLQAATERAQVEMRDAWVSLTTSLQRVQAAQDEVLLSEQLEAAEVKRFTLGDSTLFLVNLREQGTAEARLRKIEAELDTRRAEATLRAALAQP